LNFEPGEISISKSTVASSLTGIAIGAGKISTPAYKTGVSSWAWAGRNEFYKKGMSRKNSASTGVESVSRDPARCSFTSLERFGLLSILVSFSALMTMTIELERGASKTGCFRGNHGSARHFAGMIETKS
jgi:hypothetical protein